ncbi:hypothetical protein [Pseudomonas sp. 5P_3.1_Bac2]|uniref:hypothetical protein n=1 Tax=Pseudomonas sp. 5P_3.1_Bac2 TaxID=2971617 RepID=UPI0021C9D36B|nr:hypothetical protein [Pseudomonas sp. 5P_3.1_Bac2]MCU1719458.1 hypothetical protein [Pseudomonas sp. 5P_3.1_Bac2]
MKKIVLTTGLILISSSLLAANLTERTSTVKGSKPAITSTVGIFNYSMRGWPPTVGDELRHYTISAKDPDGDPVSTRIEWLRDGVVIPGATALAYKTVSADIGSNLVVRMYVWSPSATTDPSEGDVVTTPTLGEVQGAELLYPPAPIYRLNLAATTGEAANAACQADGARLPTSGETYRTYMQSTSATGSTGNNTDMCTQWGWPLNGQCGGTTDTYWINYNGYKAYSMRTGSQGGTTGYVMCVKN